VLNASDQVLCVAFRRGIPTRQLARARLVSAHPSTAKAQRSRSRPASSMSEPRCACPPHLPHLRLGDMGRAAQAIRAALPAKPGARRSPRRSSARPSSCATPAWTWKRIEQELGWPYQSLMRWIWRLLSERGELTEANVEALLRDRRDRRHQPRWAWLAKRTGLSPEPGRPGPLPDVA
jgi:hypothetical protein